MGKNFGSSNFIAFAFKMIRGFYLVVAFWPMCHKTAAETTAVAGPYNFLEGPVWKGLDQTLYFFEQIDKKLIKYNPEDQSANSVSLIGDKVMLMVPVIPEKNTASKFVIGYGRRFSVIQWDGTSTESTSTESLEPLTDLNEVILCGKSDANHRLWIGTAVTTTSGVGRLSSMDAAGVVTNQLELLNSPGAIAWSVGSQTIYYSDIREKTIIANSFDLASGKIGNDPQKIFDFKENQLKGVPAGMTVDITGYLWVACKQDGKVLKINTENRTLMEKFDIPVSSVTNVAFGGDKLQDLYVTTSVVSSDADLNPQSGSLFIVSNTGSNGFYPSEIDVKWAKIP